MRRDVKCNKIRLNSSRRKRGRLRCGRERNCEVRENRDNAGLKNTGSGTEWEIKRDKERDDTDTTDKQTDGHYEQSATTLHLTVKPTNTNITPSSHPTPPVFHSSIPASFLCLLAP